MMKKVKDSQEDWTTFPHDKSERHFSHLHSYVLQPLTNSLKLSLPSVFHLCVGLSVRQLIKSQRVQNKLGIVFEKEKDKSQRKDFIFASAKVSRHKTQNHSVSVKRTNECCHSPDMSIFE